MPVIIPPTNNRRGMIIISEENMGPKTVPPPLPAADMVMMQKIMKKLREADSNNDGRYDRDELKRALRDLGAIFPSWRANRCFERVDANNDGEISGTEIDALLKYLRSLGYGKQK